MIIKSDENPNRRTFAFGHGSLGIHMIVDREARVSVGLFLNELDKPREIGNREVYNPKKTLNDLGDGVFLRFDNVEALEVLMHNLAVARQSMITGKKAFDLKDELCWLPPEVLQEKVTDYEQQISLMRNCGNCKKLFRNCDQDTLSCDYDKCWRWNNS